MTEANQVTSAFSQTYPFGGAGRQQTQSKSGARCSRCVENREVWKAETKEFACTLKQVVFSKGVCVCMYVCAHA